MLITNLLINKENKEKLDVKWMICNPAPEEVVFFLIFFESIF